MTMLTFDPKTMAPIPALGVDAAAFGSMPELSPVTLAQLRRAHDTRGRAVSDGLVSDRDAQEYLHLSDEALEQQPCAAWLVRQRVLHIPRFLDARLPLPLFPPRAVRSAKIVGVTGAIKDLCSWIVIPCWPSDPLGELPGPVPVSDLLDVLEVLGLSGLSYSAIARARREDADFMEVLEPLRGGFRYRTRATLEWLRRGRRRRG